MTAPTLEEGVFRMSCFGCAHFRRREPASNACPVGGLARVYGVAMADARCRAGFQPKSNHEALQ